MEVSKKFSFKGWNFGTWINKNKGSLKTILSLVLGLVATRFGDSAFVSAVFGGASAVGTRIILDTFDYFITEFEE
ncbi:hypothetical protein LCGC14_2945650 [marine sediment metagenome]|uniref:Uncharacterized protein n=1 Tax=marine sediment metagenome TaxID=412755 RepID=A0A0F8XGI4_9ZZZZ